MHSRLPPSILKSLPPLDPADRPETVADRAAHSRFSINLSALSEFQPSLTPRLKSIPTLLAWTFGRDGFLTARDSAGFWWNGCSIPLAAGREMFKKLELVGAVACFVCPKDAGQLKAGFEKLARSQAIVAIMPDIVDLAVALHCEDFSGEIAAHRLWFAAGWDWSSHLANLFQTRSGLAIPQQFLRTNLLDDADLAMVAPQAEMVFSAETNRRAQEIGRLKSERESRQGQTGAICVVAPSTFQLGNLSGVALRDVFAGSAETDAAALGTFHIFDTDDPFFASPLALAQTMIHCDAIVTSDYGRSDLQGVVANNVPWISWITQGRIPVPDPGAPQDRLLLATKEWKSAAIGAGWPEEKIQFAGWPSFIAEANPEGQLIGLLADTTPIEMPPRISDYSSHTLLWETIEDDLRRNPLAVGTDATDYLRKQIRRLNVTEEGLNQAFFIEKLIEPSYHQGIARALLAAKVPIVLVGKGWLEIQEFAEHAAGPVNTLEELREAIRVCKALVHPKIENFPSALDSVGLPLIRPLSLAMQSLIQQSAKAQVRSTSPDPLTVEKVLH